MANGKLDRWGLIRLVALGWIALSTPAYAQWDFEYSYVNVYAPNADDYVQSSSNIEKSNEGIVKYYNPVANGSEAQITYLFTLSEEIEEAYLFAHLASYNFGGGSFGSGSLWASTDGNDWQLLMDAPTPGGSSLGYFYDQNLPESLLGGNSIWIQTRMTTSGSNIMAQFSRTDDTHPTEIFQFKANTVPEPAGVSLLLGAVLFAGLMARRR